MTVELLWNRASRNSPVLLLAHGAGAPMDSDFMNSMADTLQQRGVSVARFEFPYMLKRRQDQRKRPPDRQPVLLQAFAEAAQQAGGAENIFIGGKSMGGRMATWLATMQACRAVVCLGYPFHPPGKPDTLRIEHLADSKAPVLICQGERDPFGKRDEVSNYTLPSQVSLCWLADGNHDLVPRVRSGLSGQDNIEMAAQRVSDWIGKYC